MKRNGFTLIEFLTVFAVVVIVTAILFPAFLTARRASYGSTCRSNLRQIYTATLLYAQDHDDRFPPVYFGWGVGGSFGETVNREEHELRQRRNPRSFHNVYRPYLKPGEVFRCPADGGMALPQDVAQDVRDERPAHERFGTSYRPAYEIAHEKRELRLSDVAQPSEIFWAADATGYWHTKYFHAVSPEDDYEGSKDSRKWQLNALFLDGSIRTVRFHEDLWVPYRKYERTLPYYWDWDQ